MGDVAKTVEVWTGLQRADPGSSLAGTRGCIQQANPRRDMSRFAATVDVWKRRRRARCGAETLQTTFQPAD